MASLEIKLRQVSVDDRDFLLQVYASTRAGELALTGWGADACNSFVRMQYDAQATHYLKHWPRSEHSVIELAQYGKTEPVGRLWIDRREREIHVLDISVLPKWRNREIGSVCLRQFMREAANGGQHLTIQVEEGNPARRLYDRLGFTAVGPLQGLHQLMTWKMGAGTEISFEDISYEQA